MIISAKEGIQSFTVLDTSEIKIMVAGASRNFVVSAHSSVQ